MLPAGGQTTPMTYEANGKQYVVVYAGAVFSWKRPAGNEAARPAGVNRSETGCTDDGPAMVMRGTMQETADGQARRSSERFTLNLVAEGGDESGAGYSVLVHNLSASGMLIETDAALAVGRRFRIALPEAEQVVATVVWNSERLFGCRFDAPLGQSVLSATRLRNPLPSEFDPSRLALRSGIALGLRIRGLREAQGLSLSALARKAGLSKPSIWAWEAGKSVPRRKNLDALAAALDVPADDITNGDAAVPPTPGSADAGDLGSLREEIDASKRRIAQAAGVPLASVKIAIEL